MCTTCGCSHGEIRIEKTNMDHSHDHPPHSSGFSEASEVAQDRMIEVELNILSKNDQYAAKNRQLLSQNKVTSLNLLSSPGSGKTTLLTNTIQTLLTKPPQDIHCRRPEYIPHNLAVIEGDQETSEDAARIRATGVTAVQINTGKGCHLDAHMVGHAIEKLELEQLNLLFIENVGNLVCPAAFDLGEQAKVVILSVTEGEDKPLKYPQMFHVADVILLTKVDLLPYLDFDVNRCIENAKKINPRIKVFCLSAKTGEGLDQWINWIDDLRGNHAH